MERLRASLSDRYRLERELGQGGMATVYLAEDLKHKRHVAIKVLKPELAAVLGAERFVQEITTTAALQHPHILPLFDSGVLPDEHGYPTGCPYYVMPFIDGETLRGKLDRETQLGIDDALRITIAVADALGYAHRHGVIHRDIKPENILLHEGSPVVMDFGIALAVQKAGGQRMTETGLLLGTPQYMSPEQALGEKTLDPRSDLYALAAVLYEMLTGEAPFTGPTVQAIMARVMTEEPKALVTKRKTVPPGVDHAVLRALEKTPADRFETAGDFARALAEAHAGTTYRPRSAMAPGDRLRLTGGAVAAAALTLAVGIGIGRSTASTADAEGPSLRRWNLLLPAEAPLALTGPGPLGVWQLAVAISPSGDQLAYVSPRDGTTRIALRPLDRDTTVVLPETEGAYHPFFSPDGRWIAYFAGTELRKVPVTGGASLTLTTVERPSGALWLAGDEILLFQQDGFQMRRISASGGRDSTTPLPVQFGVPRMLPGGRWIVGHMGSGQLALLSLEDATIQAITRRGAVPLDSVRVADMLLGSSPGYVSSGHLVYGTGDGVLMALPFDPVARRVLGDPVPVVDGVRIEEGFGFVQYAIAPDGTLIFVPGRSQLQGHVAFIQPDGGFDTLPLPRGQYTQPRLSPDGTRLAIHRARPAGGWEILVANLETGAQQRVEVAGNYRAYPAAWTPDGQGLMVGLFRPVGNVFLGARMYSFTRGSWVDLPPFDGSYMSIAPGGERFVYSNWRTGALFLRSLGSDTTTIPIPARGTAASFSPDGQWLAWGGADGGVAASAVPPTGAIHPVAARGQQPVWMPDGRSLIYRDGRRFFQVTVDVTGGFRTGRPRLVAEGPFIRTFAWNHTLSKTGRLAALVALPGDETRALDVISGFAGDLTRRAPAQARP